MNPSKKRKVSDKTPVDSNNTAESQSTLLPITNNEVEPDTIADEGEEDSESCKINELNHDCLAKVFMHLPVLDRLATEKVCQKWKEATEMSYYNIKKINFNELMIPLDKQEETWKEILIKCRQYLTHLTISAKYTWIYDSIINNCDNLIHFDVEVINNNRKVPRNNLLLIVQSMPKLKYLKVSINSDNLYNFFTPLLELLPADIEEIHLVAIQNDDCEWQPEISTIPDKFKSLRCLTLRGFRLDQSIMELISLNSKTLVHLDLSFCNSSPDASVFSKLYNLEYLALDWMKNLDADIVTAIARNCEKLNHFEFCCKGTEDEGIYKPQFVPDDVFCELGHLKNLEYLNFHGLIITHDDDDDDDDDVSSGLSNITNNCKKLKHFDVDSGFCFSSSDIKEITKLKNLESLNLGSAYVSSESFIEITTNCLELKDIIMSSMDTKINLEEFKIFKKLEKLRFAFSRNLTGNVLINILSNCTNLRDIDMCVHT